MHVLRTLLRGLIPGLYHPNSGLFVCVFLLVRGRVTHRPMLLFLFLLAMHHAAAASSDLYFYVSNLKPTCFVDEISEDATLVLAYTHKEFKSKRLRVVISMPPAEDDNDQQGEDSILKEFEITSAKGRFAYSAEHSAQHKICIQAAADEEEEWDEDAKFFLKTEVLLFDSAPQASQFANRSHVVTLQQELGMITNRVEVILKDLQMARSKETHFRDQGERVNQYVVWLSIAQTVFLLAVAAFQSIHLHNFFLHKKIA